jgi:hypothetical protein
MHGTSTPLKNAISRPEYGGRITTIFPFPKIYINGGRRGLLVEITSADLLKALPLQEVHVALAE